MGAQEIRVEGYEKYWEIVEERTRVAEQIVSLRKNGNAESKEEIRRLRHDAPKHPLTVPKLIDSALEQYHDPAWRQIALHQASLGLFAQRFAKSANLPLRRP